MPLTISTNDVMATIRDAGGTEQEANEIANHLDKMGSFSEWLRPDGQVNFLYTHEEQAHVCQTIREVIKARPSVDIQSAVLKLLDPSKMILPTGQQTSSSAVDQPEAWEDQVARADAFSDMIVMMNDLQVISKNLPPNSQMAGEIQRVITNIDAQIKAVGAETFMKFRPSEAPKGYQEALRDLTSQLKTASRALFGCSLRMKQEGLTEENIKKVTTALKALTDFSRFREGALRLNHFSQITRVASNGQAVAIAVRETTVNVPVIAQVSRVTGFLRTLTNAAPGYRQLQSLLAPNSVTSSPSVRPIVGGLLAVGAVAALGVGAYYYFSGSEAEAAPVSLKSGPDAGAPKIKEKDQTKDKPGIPVEQLEPYIPVVDIKDLPKVPSSPSPKRTPQMPSKSNSRSRTSAAR